MLHAARAVGDIRKAAGSAARGPSLPPRGPRHNAGEPSLLLHAAALRTGHLWKCLSIPALTSPEPLGQPLGSRESSWQVQAAQRAAVTCDQVRTGDQLALTRGHEAGTNPSLLRFPPSALVSSAACLYQHVSARDVA